MQNTMKQARAEYRNRFSRVIENKDGTRQRVWDESAPGLRTYVRSPGRWSSGNCVGKLAQILG